MKMIQYSPSQNKIVEMTEGAMAVVASAGSGKTRVLTGRISYLLQNIPGSYRVLALTFTNKAAEEMKSRLSDIPNMDDRVFIGTIHSFCLNLIREKGNVIGFNEMPHIFNKESDRLEVVIEVLKRNELLARDYNNKDERERKKLSYNALEYISERKRNLRYSIEENDEEYEILFNDYNSLLHEQNAIDYDDIILYAYRIITERPKIAELYRKLYRYICVDEAQDLNFAQYEFIRALCGTEHKNILMVGDDKQAIFGFNGSDKKYFSQDFISDFNAQRIELTENYRSSKAVIRVANHIFPNSNDETKAATNGLVEFYAGKDESDEAAYVVKTIQEYVNIIKKHGEIEGDITYEDICVIARNKYVLKPIETLLEDKKIPYYYKRGSDTVLFESELLKLFDLGIRVILNPQDKLHVRQMIQLLKYGDVGTCDLQSVKKLVSTKGNELLSCVLNAWAVLEKDPKAYRQALDSILESAKLITIDSDEEKLMLYNEIENAKEYWKKYCSSVSSDSISVQGFLSNIALGLVNTTNKKEKGVTLATVHSVKGLEYDIVFIVGLNEGGFPDYRAVQSGGKSLEEEKNNTNVAVTRSRRFLYLSYPMTKLMPWDKTTPYPQKLSRFLNGIESIVK